MAGFRKEGHIYIYIYIHMSHAPETSMRSYQFPSMEDCVDTQYTIQQLQARKYFSKEEDRKILRAWPLTKEMTPALRVCRGIMEKYELARTAKQIQDRWKTLAKQKHYSASV